MADPGTTPARNVAGRRNRGNGNLREYRTAMPRCGPARRATAAGRSRRTEKLGRDRRDGRWIRAARPGAPGERSSRAPNQLPVSFGRSNRFPANGDGGGGLTGLRGASAPPAVVAGSAPRSSAVAGSDIAADSSEESKIPGPAATTRNVASLPVRNRHASVADRKRGIEPRSLLHTIGACPAFHGRLLGNDSSELPATSAWRIPIPHGSLVLLGAARLGTAFGAYRSGKLRKRFSAEALSRLPSTGSLARTTASGIAGISPPRGCADRARCTISAWPATSPLPTFPSIR